MIGEVGKEREIDLDVFHDVTHDTFQCFPLEVQTKQIYYPIVDGQSDPEKSFNLK